MILRYQTRQLFNILNRSMMTTRSSSCLAYQKYFPANRWTQITSASLQSRGSNFRRNKNLILKSLIMIFQRKASGMSTANSGTRSHSADASQLACIPVPMKKCLKPNSNYLFCIKRFIWTFNASSVIKIRSEAYHLNFLASSQNSFMCLNFLKLTPHS